MTDSLARILGGLGLAAGLVALFVSIQAGNAPVDQAVVQPKFPGGVYIANAGTTPGAIIQANATGVPMIKFINAAGTEVANISSTGVLIAPAAATATP